jgi:hypothetical protein
VLIIVGRGPPTYSTPLSNRLSYDGVTIASAPPAIASLAIHQGAQAGIVGNWPVQP